jgi:transposase
MRKFEPLTDALWERLSPLFPTPVKRGRGKPHSPWRAVVNSVLFVLLSKAKWGSWPKTEEFSSKSAAHRWFLEWDRNGLLTQVLAIVKEAHPECEVATPQRRVHPIREEIIEEETPNFQMPYLNETASEQIYISQ